MTTGRHFNEFLQKRKQYETHYVSMADVAKRGVGMNCLLSLNLSKFKTSFESQGVGVPFGVGVHVVGGALQLSFLPFSADYTIKKRANPKYQKGTKNSMGTTSETEHHLHP